jgi:hypothetical protein
VASLNIISSYHAVAANGLTVPFGATGGIPPYTWSVLPNGAGGTIGSSTGIYVSSSQFNYGPDTIQVKDIAGNIAQYEVLVCTPLELVCDIIQTTMGLSQGQVYQWDQKINIPIDSALYVAVGVQSTRPFGNRPKYTGGGSNGAPLTAIQTVNIVEVVSIDILSRSSIARDQKEQILLALSSPYAEAQMELNSFFVGPLSTSFVNLSHIDSAAIPYRFQILVQLQYFSTLVTAPAYFNTFGYPAVITEP